MKEIEIVKDDSSERAKIKTPWLRADEAAKYLGVSRSLFDRYAKGMRHGFLGNVRVYHVHVLDDFCQGGECDGDAADGSDSDFRCARET